MGEEKNIFDIRLSEGEEITMEAMEELYGGKGEDEDE